MPGGRPGVLRCRVAVGPGTRRGGMCPAWFTGVSGRTAHGLRTSGWTAHEAKCATRGELHHSGRSAPHEANCTTQGEVRHMRRTAPHEAQGELHRRGLVRLRVTLSPRDLFAGKDACVALRARAMRAPCVRACARARVFSRACDITIIRVEESSPAVGEGAGQRPPPPPAPGRAPPRGGGGGGAGGGGGGGGGGGRRGFAGQMSPFTIVSSSGHCQ
jgi:hypothetical protein